MKGEGCGGGGVTWDLFGDYNPPRPSEPSLIIDDLAEDKRFRPTRPTATQSILARGSAAVLLLPR